MSAVGRRRNNRSMERNGLHSITTSQQRNNGHLRTNNHHNNNLRNGSNGNRVHNGNNQRLTGRKRQKPDSSDDDDDDDEEYEEEDDEDDDDDEDDTDDDDSESETDEDEPIYNGLKNGDHQHQRNNNNRNNHNGYHLPNGMRSQRNHNHNGNGNGNRNGNGYHHHPTQQTQQTQMTYLASQQSSYSSQSQSQSQSQYGNKRRKILHYNTQNNQKWKQNQSNIQRRSTRLRYRKLADETQDNRAQIVDPMSNQFMDKLEEQNKIYEDVCHPNEAFMDIEQANRMTNILREQTRTLANEQFTITPQDYIASIKREFALNKNNNSSQSNDDDEIPTQIDWTAVGQKMAPWFLTIPSIQFMNGPLQQCEQVPEVQKKTRQVRQKKTFTTDAPVIQPKKVVKQKKADRTETKSRVTYLRKKLRKKCEQTDDGINPFPFLVNPNSYSQTVENLFDMSFIMKEGFAQMDLDENTQQPVLSFVSSSERTRRHTQMQQKKNRVNRATKGRGKGYKTNGQCIVKFNPRYFEQIINVYNITESQIRRADNDGNNEHDKTSNVAASSSSSGSNEEEEDDEEEDSDSESSNDDEDDDISTTSQSQRRRRGLGRARGRGRGRGRRGRGRGRGRRRNDKEEAD